jgi:hypothetical protein
MAKYPIRFKIATPAGKVTGKAAAKPATTPAQTRPAPPVTQGALDRYARLQDEETRSESRLVRRGNPDVIRTTVNMRATPTKKDR